MLLFRMNIEKNLRKKMLPIFPKASHVIPYGPMATKPYPIVAPTILWVPETGRLKNVAISNHKLVLVRALKEPAIANSSLPLNLLMSIIPFRTVSKTRRMWKYHNTPTLRRKNFIYKFLNCHLFNVYIK